MGLQPNRDASRELLEWGVEERAKIKADMDVLDQRLKNVNSAVLATMIRLEMKSYQHTLGTLSFRDASESHGIDKSKLIEALVGSGLSAEKVGEIIAAADKVTKRPATVSFTPDRSEKDGT
jgi:hypothetical protein